MLCGAAFTRTHTADKPPRYCSRACANRAPGRMTPEVRARIGRPNARNKGGYIVRTGRSKRGYVHVYVPVAERHLHPTLNRAKRTIQRSHYVWNHNHPDDPVLPGQLIHHLDDNSLNDAIDNLEKLPSQSAHASIHFRRPRRPLSEAHKAAISRTKKAKRS